ncbi:MAG: ABC transporter permease [bacterium]
MKTNKQPNLNEEDARLRTMRRSALSISKLTLASPLAYVIAFLLTFLIGGAVIYALTGQNPISVYGSFFAHSFFSEYGILEVLAKATPIIIAGAGMIIAFRCGLWNLGAEGQMAIGAIVSTAIGVNLNLPAGILLPIIFLASFVGGALWSGIAGFLKTRFGVHEMLSTLMLNYIALKLLEYMIIGPLSMPHPNYPRSSEILLQAQMPFLQYPLNVTFLIALALIPIVWFILNRTSLGYRLQAVGFGREAARLAGMDIAKLTMIVMLVSGGISALGGTVEVVGDFMRMERNVTGGYGFTAIVVVMLAREEIIAMPFAAFFISGMIVGASSLTLAGIPAAFSQILIGLLLLCVVFAGYIERWLRHRWEYAGKAAC